jgi:hypothetical protein
VAHNEALYDKIARIEEDCPHHGESPAARQGFPGAASPRRCGWYSVRKNHDER